MSRVLAAVGAATFEMIGLGPDEFGYEGEAIWAGHEVFGTAPVYQPTGMGERLIPIRAACRPHVTGGLDAWAVLKRQQMEPRAWPFIRLTGGLVGEIGEEVAIRRVSSRERKIAPDGIGWMWEFDVELLIVGSET